ncbi:MAG: YdcF family protein [Bdellovibrionales bacterium]|nr:YdcF family protein [Bdellovibrionales bacterium]MBT3526214.1 YdcF family protein [Bdellovibrionales bacterium]MBT7668186.1 YdcF family protein [Bdellovibrionales bacterium]MBT7765851.1 YdcF family protein [Bdellovibrionales bacterium]
MASDHFFKKPPDLIVVFTGDYGRISYALNKSEEYRQPHLFVTGVFSKNTVNSLLTSLKVSERFDSRLIEIDYLARNTVENAIATIRYLRSKKTMNNILLISHDYHIMRIKLIINTILRPTDNYQFYYMGIDSDYLRTRNLKVLITEAFKLMRTFGFLLFWDPQ